MTHQSNCLHVATQWFNLLWPSGSVTWRKKQLDIPVLTEFVSEMTQITSAHSPLTRASHMDILNNQLCALMIKGTGKCGWIQGMFDEGYSFSHLWPTRPHLPSCLTILCSLSHSSCFSHTRLLGAPHTYPVPFYIRAFAVFQSYLFLADFFQSFSSQLNVTIPAKIPTSPHHHPLSSCLD